MDTASESAELKRVLADNLRCYRKKMNMSQEQLAEVCALHRTYIGSVEREERNVTLHTLVLLAKALRITVPCLLSKGMRI